MRLLFLIMIFIVPYALGDVQPKWELNDVSYLFSLPASFSKDSLLKLSSKGKYGDLLSRAYFDALPPITLDLTPDQTYQQLRVVGIRIDPCFAGPSSGQCQPQVRLVWQPLVERSTGATLTTDDAAIHTFYNIPTNEFNDLLNDLQKLKRENTFSSQGLPLGVHPGLNNDDKNVTFIKALEEVFLARIGFARVSRVTFMQLSGAGNIWNFGGFNVCGGKLVRLLIPRIMSQTQTFVNNPFPENTYFDHAYASPEPKGNDTFNLIIHDSRLIAPSDEPNIKLAAVSMSRIENPKFHTSESVDCVSCHLAQPARTWTVRQFPWLHLQMNEFIYRSEFNLTNVSPSQENTTIIRGFGYFERQPAISQRAINESAEIADQLNKVH